MRAKHIAGGISLFVVLWWLLPLLLATLATLIVFMALGSAALTLAAIHETVPKDELDASARRFLMTPLRGVDEGPKRGDYRWASDPSMDDVLTPLGRTKYRELRTYLIRGTWPAKNAPLINVYDPHTGGNKVVPDPDYVTQFTWVDYITEVDKLFEGRYPYQACIPEDMIDAKVQKANAKTLMKASRKGTIALGAQITKKYPGDRYPF